MARASKFIILYFILISLHRILDSVAPMEIDLFLFIEKTQDLQWYVKDFFDIIAFSVICFYLYKISPASSRFATGLFFIYSIIQLPLYFLFYLRYDVIIDFTIIIVILIKIKLNEKRTNIK